jgi:hypothetical protein
MICLKCDEELSCFDSRQLDKTTRWRLYACLKCNVVYSSEEKISPEVTDRNIPKRLLNKTKGN